MALNKINDLLNNPFIPVYFSVTQPISKNEINIGEI